MPAEIYIWNGATDTAWKAAGGSNWEDEAGSAHGANQYPGLAAGDQAWFTKAVTNAPAGVDLSGDAELERIIVGPLFNKGVGSSGTYVQVEMENLTTSTISIDGEALTAGIYLKGKNTDGLGRVIVLNSNSQTVSLDGIIGSVYAVGGTVNIESTMTACTSLTVGSKASSSVTAAVTIEASAAEPTRIIQLSGSLTNNIAITANLTVAGGTWTNTTGNITLLTLIGGTFVWTAGTITDAFVFGGTLDGSDSVTARTITRGYVYTGGRLDMDNGAFNIAVGSFIEDMGGTIDWCDAERIHKYS